MVTNRWVIRFGRLVSRPRVATHTLVVATVAAATLGGACTAPIRVEANVDPDVPLDGYVSFTFDETARRPSGDPRIDDPLFEQRLHAAVAWELATRGIGMTGEGPALTLHHHVNVHDVVEFIEWDHDDELVSMGVDPQAIEHREATFMVGVADAETGRIVWRGWANLSAEGNLDDPAWMRARIDEAVARMFELFPRAPRR